jgi:hypothetical protein
MLNMESFEDSSALKGCTDLGRARIARAKALLVNAPRARGLVGSADLAASSPTKELDALVLGNSLIGYGDGISLENMMIIENLISFSKLEADHETKSDPNPAAWHRAFINCMLDMGCSVPIHASLEYKKQSGSGTMKNVVTSIVQAGIAAAVAAIPGATVLSAVADSTLTALEKEPDTVKLFNYDVVTAKGVKLAILPCEQAKNGLIIVSFSSINHESNTFGGEVLFFDLKVTNVDIYQGSNFLTFNTFAYAEIKDDIESVLGLRRKEIRSKRFARHRK